MSSKNRLAAWLSAGVAGLVLNLPAPAPAAIMLVSDGGNHRVLQYEVKDNVVAYTGVFAQGTYAGTALSNPHGMAFSHDGFVYVGEQRDNGRILRFAPDGTFLDVVAQSNVGGFSGGRPASVEAGPDGNIYVTTAFGGARNAHDANYLTFHRFENFRKLTLADSAVDPETLQPAGPAKVELGAVTVEGQRFAMRTLRNGGEAFGNRTYVWEQVPERLQGWRYTQTHGGVAAGLHATAARDATLYMATADHLRGIDTSGWTPEPDLAFRYTDHARTPLQVFRRAVRAGERVAIPEGNWTGGLLLVPPEE